MSTYGAVLKYLEKNFKSVQKSEYFAEMPPGSIIKGIVNQDVQNLTYADSSVDLITSNQVFEHVPNDIKGFEECYRVLKVGGALIFSVPLYDSMKTEKLAEFKGNEIVYYTTPEYHDSRTEGAKSALTFWRHSKNDICDRVAKAGFNAQLVDVIISPSQKIPTQVIYAVK